MRVRSGGIQAGILIENKISATEQERQAERYRLRADRARDAGKFHHYFTVMVAPERYLATVPDASVYDRQVSYESIAKWFGQSFERRANGKKRVIEDAKLQLRRSGSAWVQRNPDKDVTSFHVEYTACVNSCYPKLVKEYTTSAEGAGLRMARAERQGSAQGQTV